MLKRLLPWLILTPVLAIWLTFLIPWNGFPDPDALYHATYSNLMVLSGSVMPGGIQNQGNFPWLDLTILGKHFSDQHLLFHALQMPFVSFFGVLNGSRISSVVFAVICLLGLGFILRKFKINFWWFWVLLLAVSQPFATRIIQGKASPLAILVWFAVVALAMVYVISREVARLPQPELGDGGQGATRNLRQELLSRTLIGVFILSAAFTLLHGGWILLPVSLGLIWIGEIFFHRVIPAPYNVIPDSIGNLTKSTGQAPAGIQSPRVLDPSANICEVVADGDDTKKAQDDRWKALWPLGFSLLGILVGLVIHPGRSQLVKLFWIQVVQIGIFTPANLNMGNEWSPASWQATIGLFSVTGILLIIGIIGIFLAPKKQADSLHTKTVLILSPLIAFLFAFSLKSLRYGEYFQPLFTFWIALIIQWTDWKKFFEVIALPVKNFVLKNSLLMAITFCVLVSVVSSAYGAYSAMHGKMNFIDTTYKSSMEAIAAEAKPGDRVFHAQWDEFPMLFYRNQNLKYISGLDPTFLYDASTTLALDYSKFSYNAASTTKDFAWNFIHDRLGSNYLLIDFNRWPALNSLILSDPRYVLISRGDGGAAYRITKE